MSKQQSRSQSASAEPAAVERVAVFVHGRPERVGDAPERLRALAGRLGIEVAEDPRRSDLVVVLGGDGTMLRALQQMLGSGVPCLGVNYGRVGFLTSIEGSGLEDGLAAALAGGYEVLELPTIVAAHGGRELVGINDIVLTSSILGRMAMLEWQVDDQTLGEVACDGAILATPTGSTAYNLSAGGPVLAWGLDGFVLSFISPHSLHARSMVLGRPHQVELANRSEDVPLEIIVDGHVAGRLESGQRLSVSMGGHGALLARTAGTSFFDRYRSTFSA
ncbi:MAG TPA: NAD(+)/NADH kinase [Gaiellales bacterium]|jgi:NAD+ kinase|nr:NAD(+)/NADH kinase [Gaiellales bacterium]